VILLRRNWVHGPSADWAGILMMQSLPCAICIHEPFLNACSQRHEPLSNQIEGVDTGGCGMRWGQKKYCLRYIFWKAFASEFRNRRSRGRSYQRRLMFPATSSLPKVCQRHERFVMICPRSSQQGLCNSTSILEFTSSNSMNTIDHSAVNYHRSVFCHYASYLLR
jgi:hypothetical protein